MEFGYVCPRCVRGWTKGDKFCRFCGTAVTRPHYIEEPPRMLRTHHCGLCGLEWITCLVEDQERFCPQCGTTAPVISEEMVPSQIPLSVNWGDWDEDSFS